jgi:hypothetical protein
VLIDGKAGARRFFPTILDPSAFAHANDRWLRRTGYERTTEQRARCVARARKSADLAEKSALDVAIKDTMEQQ